MDSRLTNLSAGHRKWRLVLLFALLVGLAIGGGVWTVANLPGSEPPEAVVTKYVTAYYARDYATVYELLSDADRQIKSREAYLRENDSFSGFALQLAYRLASYIEFAPLSMTVQGDAGTVVMKLRVPDGNAPAVQEILLAADKTPNLPPARQQELTNALEQLHRSGQIPMFDVEPAFQLVKGKQRWAISIGARGFVRVRFSSAVKYGLPWEFAPVQEEVLAKPGETLQAIYRVKNLSDREITGTAVHTVEPKEQRQYLETIQCFCFIRQTLEPGEEQLLKLVFRVAEDVPASATEFRTHYDFYPIQLAPSHEP